MNDFFINVESVSKQNKLLEQTYDLISVAEKKMSEANANIKSIGLASIEQSLIELENKLTKHVSNVNSLAQCLKNVVGEYIAMELGILGNSVLDGLVNDFFKATDNHKNTGDSKTNEDTVNPDEMSYEEYIDYRIENAVDENTRKLYEKYKDKLKIKDDDYDDGAYYNSIFNHIKLSEEADNQNPRGRGTTHFHEFGHMVDDKSDWNDETSNDWSYDFGDTLQEDYENYIDQVMIDNNFTDREDAYQYVEDWLSDGDADMKHSVSDLITGLSDGDIEGPWRHDANYYSESKIENEAFAHFFEAGMCTDSTKLDYIKMIFPNAYEEYQQMLEDELDS